MIKKLFQLLCICLCAFVCSCSNPSQKAIRDLESLTYEIEESGSSYTADDWEIAGYQFEAILEDIDTYYSEYTDDQLREIGRLKGKCAAAITKHTANALKDHLDRLGTEADGFLEGLAEALEELDL